MLRISALFRLEKFASVGIDYRLSGVLDDLSLFATVAQSGEETTSMRRTHGIPILSLYFACAIFCAASAYVFLPRIQYALCKDFFRQRQHDACRIVLGELNSTLEKAKFLLQLGAGSPEVILAVQGARGTDAASGCLDELARLIEGVDVYRMPILDFLLLDGQGDIIGASGADRGSRSMAPYFTVPMQGKSYIGVPGVSASAGRSALRIAEPVLAGGIPAGVLALTLDLGKIADNWQRHLEAFSLQAVFLLDPEGKIVVHSDIAKSGMELEYAEPVPYGGAGEYATVDYIRDGKIRMLTYGALPLAGWTLVVSSAEKATLADEGFSGSFDALVFTAAFFILFFGLCAPLQVVFHVMRGKASASGPQALLPESVEDGIMACDHVQPPGALPARLRECIDALPVGIGIAVAGQCRFANPALQAMADVAVGDAVPSPLMDALGALQTGNAADARHLRLPVPDGGMGDFLLNSAVVEYERTRGVAFCLADLSGQKRFERDLIAARDAAEAAADARGRFLAMVSHEVRTPLNGVMGLLQIIALQEADSELKEYLDSAFSLCKHLVQILSDILDLSRIESGSLLIAAEEFSLDDAARTTFVSFQEAAREKNVSLHFNVDTSLPKKLLGDAGRVRQLLWNLVGNAVKYTQAGQIEVEILRVPARDEAACKVLFVVSDTGVGISAARMAGIFEPFQRADDGYVRLQTGVGLGLAIVRRLVLLMGGELCLFSREGLGTENHLILPFALAAEAEAAPAILAKAANADDKDADRGQAEYCDESADVPRILLVDDEVTNLVTMQMLLTTLGYQADVAENGPRALQKLKERRYALVFMDIQMPGMDGYETTARIRAMPGLDPLTIVAFTGRAMHDDREKLLSQGFDEYMAKPVIVDKLQTLLRRLVG